ncbi:hypothetical protein SAMN04515674_101500 [Pseudarcicella hirudinis]|uniref:DNA cytosine methyltransferase n=3 Tax=Pseudarcicella hirudinis TaxID=1079859 RepID=A0A1I5MY65_9BACT|nr:hypothetical protein SAMN04515674_101500 [Pseudarcicella hirudinis]
MRVLVACEKSGIIRQAFEKHGHDAWSCDLQNSDILGKHYKGDVRDILYCNSWDLIIAHPVCTRLCNSSVLRLYHNSKKEFGLNPDKILEMIEAANFFKLFLNHHCERIAIENPIMHCYAKRIIGVEQTQIIQPFQFGHPESKATCLWLKGLPLLRHTEVLRLKPGERWQNQSPSGNNKLGGKAAELRAKTYQGIANAMAEQWGN